MKLYILLLFIMIPLLSYGKTDEEKLLERVDHAIEMDSHYQQQKEKELKRLRRLEAMQSLTRKGYATSTVSIVPIVTIATTRHVPM